MNRRKICLFMLSIALLFGSAHWILPRRCSTVGLALRMRLDLVTSWKTAIRCKAIRVGMSFSDLMELAGAPYAWRDSRNESLRLWRSSDSASGMAYFRVDGDRDFWFTFCVELDERGVIASLSSGDMYEEVK